MDAIIYSFHMFELFFYHSFMRFTFRLDACMLIVCVFMCVGKTDLEFSFTIVQVFVSSTHSLVQLNIHKIIWFLLLLCRSFFYLFFFFLLSFSFHILFCLLFIPIFSHYHWINFFCSLSLSISFARIYDFYWQFANSIDLLHFFSSNNKICTASIIFSFSIREYS